MLNISLKLVCCLFTLTATTFTEWNSVTLWVVTHEWKMLVKPFCNVRCHLSSNHNSNFVFSLVWIDLKCFYYLLWLWPEIFKHLVCKLSFPSWSRLLLWRHSDISPVSPQSSLSASPLPLLISREVLDWLVCFGFVFLLVIEDKIFVLWWLDY